MTKLCLCRKELPGRLWKVQNRMVTGNSVLWLGYLSLSVTSDFLWSGCKCSWTELGKLDDFCLNEAKHSFAKMWYSRQETAMRIYKHFYYFSTFLKERGDVVKWKGTHFQANLTYSFIAGIQLVAIIVWRNHGPCDKRMCDLDTVTLIAVWTETIEGTRP